MTMICKFCKREIEDDSEFCRFCGANLRETLDACVITDFSSEHFDLVLQDSVTKIRDDAFGQWRGLMSIRIPRTVTEIAPRAFYGCWNLENIVVDKDNEVYDSREGCNAIIETKSNKLVVGCRNSVIPNSVTEIGDEAFLEQCETVTISIPNSVTRIGDDVFRNCDSLMIVAIPDSVKEIGDRAFQNSGITSIYIPASVVKIGEDAFMGCRELKRISVDANNKVYDCRNNCNAIIETKTDKLVVGCDNTFIPDTVVRIGKNAFNWRRLASHFVIPNSVHDIEENAFTFCLGMDTIEVSSSLRVIEADAFSCCGDLKTIMLPGSLYKIGDKAFQCCSKLESVVFSCIITELGEDIFYGCEKLKTLYVPEGCEEWFERMAPDGVAVKTVGE